MSKIIFKISKNTFIDKCLYVALVVLAVFRATQFRVINGDNMDLVRHFNMMKLIKASSFKLFDYVLLHGDAFTSNITMRYCYTFNFLVFIAAKHLTNYYYFAWFFVFVDYAIIAYIGIDWWRHQKRSGFMILFEIMICFSMLPFFQAVSGLRTAMAACIMALGIYLYLYKEKRVLVFILFVVISCTIHPAFLTIIPFVIIGRYLDRKNGLIISIVGSLLMTFIANIMSISHNSFFRSIAYKYLQYTGEDGYRSTRFCYYGMILICTLTVIQYFLLFWMQKSSFTNNPNILITNCNSQYKLYDVIVFYMIFVLTNIGKYELVIRPGYILGALAPIITGLIFSECKSKSNNLISRIIIFMLFVILCYTTYKYLIWHSEYYRFS